MSQVQLLSITYIICRKLDYVHIHVNKDDKIEISYGSGLNNTMPTRCPLLKNLSHNLPGDNDLFSPNEY